MSERSRLAVFLAGLALGPVFGSSCASVKSADPAANTGGNGTGNTIGTGSGGNGGMGLTSTGGDRGTMMGTGTGTGCKNLQCQQPSCTAGACVQSACPNGEHTTVSGTIYDPAGTTPLYNVVVYVPNAAVAAIPQGVSCQRCDGTASGSPIASALSDATGHFVLENMPVGNDIPLVIQVGKWRRQVKIPTVTACKDTPIANKDLTRLPRNQQEGELPQIALTTGHADAMECLLRKIGISDSEFTTDGGSGRVHMYVGGDGVSAKGAGAIQFATTLNGGAKFTSALNLYGSVPKLKTYDIIALSCEGEGNSELQKPFVQNIKTYADGGGRLFTGHMHYTWMSKGAAPWPQTATYKSGTDLPDPVTVKIDDTFPKGMAFADWLVNTGASTARGSLTIFQGQNSVTMVNKTSTQQWIYYDANASQPGVEYMTFNAPVETTPDKQCGRVVFTDLHVVSAAAVAGTTPPDLSHPEIAFPTGCTSKTLSAQEKALEFMLFDLSSCVQPETVKPVPPTPE